MAGIQVKQHGPKPEFLNSSQVAVGMGTCRGPKIHFVLRFSESWDWRVIRMSWEGVGLPGLKVLVISALFPSPSSRRVHAWRPHLPSLRNLLGKLQSMVSSGDRDGLTWSATCPTDLVPNPVCRPFPENVLFFCAMGLSVLICNVETFKLTTPSHIIGF